MYLLLKLIIYLAILGLSIYIYDNIIFDFTIKKIYYLISVITSLIFILLSYYLNPLNGFYNLVTYHYIITFLIILSFTDIKYYEINPKSYYFLIGANLFYILRMASLQFIIYSLIRLIVTFFILYILDLGTNLLLKNKMINSNNQEDFEIGGADIKIILILSLLISLRYVIPFLLFTMFFGLIYYIVRSIINNAFSNQQIPLIVGITAAFILIQLF